MAAMPITPARQPKAARMMVSVFMVRVRVDVEDDWMKRGCNVAGCERGSISGAVEGEKPGGCSQRRARAYLHLPAHPVLQSHSKAQSAHHLVESCGHPNIIAQPCKSSKAMSNSASPRSAGSLPGCIAPSANGLHACIYRYEALALLCQSMQSSSGYILVGL